MEESQEEKSYKREEEEEENIGVFPTTSGKVLEENTILLKSAKRSQIIGP